MKHASSHITPALLLLAITCTGPAIAGMYKWVDENGEVHYSDRVPPEAVKQERRAINEQGRTTKIYERARTDEEIATAERRRQIALEERKKAEEQARKDEVLLSTYASEEDMIDVRDGKIESLESLIQLTERRIDSMQRRLQDLTDDAASYERSGKPVPKMLAQQIEQVREQTSENQAFIVVKREEQKAISEKFNQDITRFRQLKNKR